MSAVRWSTTLILYLDTNSSTNYTTECAFDIASFIRYWGTLTVVLGFVGNLLSMIVFSRKALRSRSCSIYFLALSMSDICVLFGYTLENLLFNGYGVQLLTNSIACKAVVFLIYASTDISNYLLVLAAIDRCVLVSQRTAHHRFCQKPVAIIFISLTVVFFSLFNSHILYGFHLDMNGACIPTPTRYAHFYVYHYDSYVDVIKTVLIPFSLIVLCNTVIVSTLTRTRRNSLSFTSSSRRRRQGKDRQLTGFLLLTSVLFVLLTLPSEINDFLRSHFTERFQVDYACQLWTMTTVFILIHQINHASHFYVYTLTGPIFREEFRRVMCFFREHPPRRESYDYVKRPSITSRCSHIDDVDVRRLNVLLQRKQSTMRVSFKLDR